MLAADSHRALSLHETGEMSIFWKVMLVALLLGLVLVPPASTESPPRQGGGGADVIDRAEVYRVGSGDVLQVTVHGTEDLRTLFTV